MQRKRNKFSINANSSGALELREFINRMAHFRKGRTLKKHVIKTEED